MSTTATKHPAPQKRSRAFTVAAGILSSRVFGLARDAIALNFFGIGAHADVLQAAFRAPNLLVNLLGEGTISAAFIPVYSRMVEEGREKEAGRLAGSIFGLLVATVSVLVLLGILFARPLLSVLVLGWVDDAARVSAGELSINRFQLTVDAVRLIFPMTGFLVLSAWALGILNSHRRFFISYFAPVVWNIAIISSFLIGATLYLEPEGGQEPTMAMLTRLLFAAFAGGLAGGILQFLVQVPSVFRVLKGFRVSLSTRVEGVRATLSAFGPAVAGRGIAQISGYADLFLASLLASGALASLRSALILYMLPISLFGLSVAAAELPELSRMGSEQITPFLERLGRSIRQSMFLTIPTAVGYVALGFLIVGALFRRGAFQEVDNWLVYVVLGGYSLGLVATTLSRLLQNAFWALRDTRTPARMAALRLIVSMGIAVPMMLMLDQRQVTDILDLSGPDKPLFLGAAGLAFGASVGAWVELWRLGAMLRGRIESFRLAWRRLVKQSTLALGAAVPALGLWWLLPASWPAPVVAALVVSCFAGIYLGMAYTLGWPELRYWAGRLGQRRRR